MIKHRFGADYNALAKRSFFTREDFPVVPGLEEEDYWALWERMEQGEDYDQLRKLLKEDNIADEHIKPVMQWLEDQALRYFPLKQEYRRARAWVIAGLAIAVPGAYVAYQGQSEGYEGILMYAPFLGGMVVAFLNWGKFRRLRALLS